MSDQVIRSGKKRVIFFAFVLIFSICAVLIFVFVKREGKAQMRPMLLIEDATYSFFVCNHREIMPGTPFVYK